MILATWEAESRGSHFQASMGKKVCKTPSQWKNKTKTKIPESGGVCLS
jgi:hypothetical protein